MHERNGNVALEARKTPKLSCAQMRIAAEVEPPWRETVVTANLSAGMLENNHMKRPRGVIDFLVSVTGHSLLLAMAIFIPLCFTNAFDLHQFEATYLVAPPLPPPPPPPPAASVHSIRRPKTFLVEHKLYAPRVIPKHIVEVKDLPNKPQSSAGVVEGVAGGVPGGQLGGVIGGILGNGTRITPPPPPPLPRPAAHRGPYRVGGNIQAPQLIRQFQPIYPPLAKEIHVQGDVIIDSVIDAQGNVTQMKVVSGHPLLIAAAMDALRQWRYAPTRLNGVPVAIEMQVTVKFRMS
jgi:protein TonB